MLRMYPAAFFIKLVALLFLIEYESSPYFLLKNTIPKIFYIVCVLFKHYSRQSSSVGVSV